RLEHFGAFEEAHLAAALGEEMKEGDVLCAGEALAHARETELAADAPRRGELGVEVHGAFQPHRLQDVRQCIHGVSVKKGGVPVKAAEMPARILGSRQRREKT